MANNTNQNPGFGERKTPEPFVAACDKFIYTEIFRNEPEEAKSGQNASWPTYQSFPTSSHYWKTR